MTVADDDPAGITLSVTSLSLREIGIEDGSGSYTVELASQPTGDVTVDISVPGLESYESVTVSTDGMNFAATASLTFTSATWDTAQTVTVKSTADDNGADISATIDHEVALGSAAEYAGATAELPVSVTDGDSATPVTADDSPLVLEGSTREFPIRLDAQPTANVTINVAVTGDLTVSADGNNYAATASVTFTPGDYSTAKTVTLAAAQDMDSVHETETATMSVATGSAAEYVSEAIPQTTNVIVADDDTSAGVTVSPATLEVDEGDTVGAVYSVVLDALPSYPVGVAVAVSESDSDVRVTPELLVFRVTNWNTPQFVTVTAVADDTDMANDSAMVLHTVPEMYSDGSAENALEYAALASVDSVAVSVVDDDRPSVSTSELSVAEGGMGTYTVVLNVAPASDVVIDVALADGSDSDVTVSPSSLTFTASGTGIWSDPQMVTVSAAEDDDSTDDAATVTHVVNNDDSDNAYDDVPIASVGVAVADNDSKVIVSVSELTVGEGDSTGEIYKVKLGQAPGSDVVIDIGFGEGSDGDVSVSTDGMNFAATGTLTFTMDNWSADQTVTVRAVSDDDSADDTATVTHTVDDGQSDNDFDGETIASVAVTVADDDPAGVVVDCPVSVLEGGTAECEVELATPPTADVTVAVAAGGGLTVSTDGNNFAATASLAFTSVTWSTDQTVTVAAASDANSAHEAETVTVSVAAGSAAEYVDAPSVTLSVVVADDDTSAGVTVTPVTLSVGEGGTKTYSVVLDALPSAPVAVSVTSGDAAVATVVPAQLVFDASDWSTAQTVTVTGVADDADMADGSATVAHAVVAEYGDPVEYSALEYAALASVDSVAVSVVDDDRPSVSTSELSVAEGGMGTYTVVLNVAPASDVVIDVALSDGSDSDVTVSPSSLTFTASGTGIWSDPQMVTVSAAEDDDSTHDAATVTHVVNNDDSDNAYDDVPIASVGVAVADNDSKVIVSVSELTVGEGDSTGEIYKVKLGQAPGSDVVIDIGFGEGSDGDVSVSTDGMNFAATGTLTFTMDNWSADQTVTVRAVSDDDSADDTATVTHTVDDGQSDNDFDGETIASVAVTVADDDPAGVVVDCPVSVLEGGTAECEVELATPPTADVTVAVAAGGGLTVSTDGNNFAATASLAFTSATWSTDQTVTVAAASDANSAHETETVTVSVAAGSAAEYVDAPSVTLSVVVADDDTSAGVTVTPVTLEVGEGGTKTYSVVLDALPSAPVAVSVTSGDAAVATVVPAQLVFDASDWSTAQTVTVTGVADGSATVAHAVVAEYTDGNGDTQHLALEYAALASVDSVAVTVADDDVGVTVSPTSLSVAEGGSGTYTVVLDAEPATDVVIDVALADGSDSDVTVSPSSLTFTASGTGIWSDPQTVTVSAAEDDDSTHDAATVTHVVNNDDSDNAYDDVPIASVGVAVADNDSKVIVSVSELTVGEGDSTGEIYKVKLGQAPGSDVVIDIGFGEGSDGDVSVSTDGMNFAATGTLTFTMDNWSADQTVTVRAVSDDDSADDTATVTHTVDDGQSDNDFDGETIASVAVTVAGRRPGGCGGRLPGFGAGGWNG